MIEAGRLFDNWEEAEKGGNVKYYSDENGNIKQINSIKLLRKFFKKDGTEYARTFYDAIAKSDVPYAIITGDGDKVRGLFDESKLPTRAPELLAYHPNLPHVLDDVGYALFARYETSITNWICPKSLELR
jgi:predicted TIM-barrel fold metal-dependent hydrolase